MFVVDDRRVGREDGGIMARPLRLEFPGAIYHVINRGNYRGRRIRGSGNMQEQR